MNSNHKPNWHTKTHARVITTVVVTALRLAGEHRVGATVLACFLGMVLMRRIFVPHRACSRGSSAGLTVPICENTDRFQPE